MATSEEIEKYCWNCVSRDFVNGKGLVCKRTRELPLLLKKNVKVLRKMKSWKD